MKKLVTLVSGKGTSGSLVIAGVFHVLDDDNTGEFDPFFIERTKNAMQQMSNKKFLESLEEEIRSHHNFNQ